MSSVSLHGWKRLITGFARDIDPAEFDALIARIPLPAQQAKWRAAREGYAEADLDIATAKVAVAVDKVEQQLAQTPWLAGDSYSLADINFFATGGNRLQVMFPEIATPQRCAHLFAWAERINARPAVQRAFKAAPTPAS